MLVEDAQLGCDVAPFPALAGQEPDLGRLGGQLLEVRRFRLVQFGQYAFGLGGHGSLLVGSKDPLPTMII